MTTFLYEQEVRVLEPLEYVPQFKSGNGWLSLKKPFKTYDQACAALIKWQRQYKRRSEGRIVIQGVVSTQSFQSSKLKT